MSVGTQETGIREHLAFSALQVSPYINDFAQLQNWYMYFGVL